GILHHAPIEEAAIAAIAAGTHLIEICKDPALVLAAYEAILSEAEQSRSFRATVEQSATIVRTHRQKLLRHSTLSPPPRAPELTQSPEAAPAFTAAVTAATPQAIA